MPSLLLQANERLLPQHLRPRRSRLLRHRRSVRCAVAVSGRCAATATLFNLFSSLLDAAYFYKCPDRLRLPLVFYVAHPASVYINKLLLAGMIKARYTARLLWVEKGHVSPTASITVPCIHSLLQERVNPEFEALFETGVDEMSWDDTVCCCVL